MQSDTAPPSLPTRAYPTIQTALTAVQQGGLLFVMASIVPAFFVIIGLMVQEGLVRPATWLLDLVGDMLNAIATLTP